MLPVLAVELSAAACFDRESCEALTDIFCANDWSTLSGGGAGVLLDCNTLSSLHNLTATPACYPVDLFAVTSEKISGFYVIPCRHHHHPSLQGCG